MQQQLARLRIGTDLQARVLACASGAPPQARTRRGWRGGARVAGEARERERLTKGRGDGWRYGKWCKGMGGGLCERGAWLTQKALEALAERRMLGVALGFERGVEHGRRDGQRRENRHEALALTLLRRSLQRTPGAATIILERWNVVAREGHGMYIRPVGGLACGRATALYKRARRLLVSGFLPLSADNTWPSRLAGTTTDYARDMDAIPIPPPPQIL